MENNPAGLIKTDTVEDAMHRADSMAPPDGSSSTQDMEIKKDLRRIVILTREVRRLGIYIETLERR